MSGQGNQHSSPPTWIDSEPGLGIIFYHLGRIWRRTKARPWIVVIVSLLFASGIVVRRAIKPNVYTGKVLLKVTENTSAEVGTQIPPKRMLRDYVTDVVFSNDALVQIRKDYRLYKSGLMDKDKELLLQTFREDIEVEVFRNYFLEDRYDDDPPRSARIMIEYTAKDPEIALAVARALSTLVVEHAAAKRREQMAQAVNAASETTRDLRTQLTKAQQDLANAQLISDETGSESVAQIEVFRLMRLIGNIQQQLLESERAEAALDFGASVEQQREGFRFEIADFGEVKWQNRMRSMDFFWLGILAFTFLLPIVAIGIHAFDTRIYRLEDVEMLTLPVLGKVKRYPGDRIGSLVQRLRKRSYVQ